MAEIIREISVDVAKDNVFQDIVAKQFDNNSRFLKVTITNNGEPMNIAPSSSVTINAQREDGEAEAFLGSINDDGTITVPLNKWMLQLDGIVKCDISIFLGESRLTTTMFSLVVEEAAYGGSDISDDPNCDLLVQLLDECAVAKTGCLDAIEELTAAKENGDFNGKDGADYILTDDDKNEIATKANAVSYSVTQDLTKEQKEIARNNIDAVDANLVVSSLSRDEQIPNGAALKEYTSKYTEYSCVRYDTSQYLSEYDQEVARSNIGAVSQAELADGLNEKIDASLVVSNIISDGTLLSDNIPNGSALTAFVREHGVASSLVQNLNESRKARARNNISAAEDTGKWELLYTIEGDGATYIWEFTKFADGSDLKLRAAAVKTINTVAASADTYGFIYAYDSSLNTIGTAIITRFLSKTAGSVALGIIEQDKGYYRAYSADGTNRNPGNVRYSGFQQYNEIGNIETTPYIPRIKVINQTTAYLPVGSTIEVWGVKA